MSLLFMLVALLGAVLVLAGGTYALRRMLERPKPPSRAEGGTSAPSISHVGGYVPAPRSPEELPSSLRTRVRDLAMAGRWEDAVQLVRERVDGDEGRARRIVADLCGPEATGGGPITR